MTLPGWNSPSAVAAISIAFGSVAWAIAVVAGVAGFQQIRRGRPVYAVVAAYSAVLAAVFQGIAMVYDQRDSTWKDRRVSEAHDYASAVRLYSKLADFNCDGTFVGPSMSQGSGLSHWYGGFGRYRRDGLHFKCWDRAVVTYARFSQKVTNYACPYYPIAYCLKSWGKPEWKEWAEVGLHHARQTCLIYGRHPDYDRVRLKLDALLRDT